MSHAFSARLRACAVALALAGTFCLAFASPASAEHFKVATAAELESAVTEANTKFSSEANTIELTSTVAYTLSAPLEFTNTSGPQELIGLPTTAPGATIGGSSPAGDVAIAAGVDMIIKRINLASALGDPAIVDLPAGHLHLDSSEVTSGIGAAGIEVEKQATAEVRNSTIGEGGLGVVDAGEASFFNTTIAYNEIGIFGLGGTLNLTNTIVAENKTSGDCKLIKAATSALSLDSDGTCGVGALSKKDPRLEPVFGFESPLSFDGGPTRIFSLKPGSPAIDAVPIQACPAFDQRGEPRPDEPLTNCDIGADEYNPTPPIWSVPSSFTVEQNVPGGASVNYAASAGSTDDLIRQQACAPASGSTFGFGTTTVHCLAIDGHAATATASFEVTVIPDDSTPEIEVPATVKAKSEGASGAIVSYKEPTAKDPDGDPISSLTCSKHPGETFPNGTTKVTCEATDAQGKSGSASFNVSVYLPAVIILHFELVKIPLLPGPGPSELTELIVNATSRAGAPVSYGITGSDNVDGAVPVRCAPGSGSTFAIGRTTVTCSATDSAGNLTSVSFVVTVLGTPEQAAGCNGLFAASAGQVNVPPGAICTVLATAHVSGNVQVQQGGALNDQGSVIGGNVQANNASSIQVQDGSIGGNLQVQGLTGGPNTLCAASVKGDVQVQNNGPLSQLSIGGPSPGSCAGLTVTGNLQAQNNAGRVTIEGNTAHRNVEVHNNTGGGVLTGNHADGNCQLQNDMPPSLGTSNTVGPGHTNTCNGSA